MSVQAAGYLAAAVLMAVFGYLYGSRIEKKGKKMLVFKALATFMAVLVSAAQTAGRGGAGSWLITVGIILCMAADVLLELRFLWGVIFFGSAHICLIAGMCPDTEIRSYTVMIVFGVYLIFAAAFLRYIGRLGPLKAPALLYPALLGCMAALAVTYGVQNKDLHGMTMAAGGLCFVVSDFILAWRVLREKTAWGYRAAVLILYYSAVYLIAL